MEKNRTSKKTVFFSFKCSAPGVCNIHVDQCRAVYIKTERDIFERFYDQQSDSSVTNLTVPSWLASFIPQWKFILDFSGKYQQYSVCGLAEVLTKGSVAALKKQFRFTLEHKIGIDLTVSSTLKKPPKNYTFLF